MSTLFDELPDKYMRFVSEYTVSGELAASAKAAGSKAKNLSQAGKEILRRPEVTAAIKEFKADLAESLKITPERVLKEYARIGFSDLGHVVKGGKIIDLDNLDTDTRVALQSVKVSTRTAGQGDDVEIENIIEVKLWSKPTALDFLGKHLGLLEKDNNQKSEHTVILHDPSKPDGNA